MKSGEHDVKPLDAVLPEHQSVGHYCDKHKERIRIYCFDCQTSVCSTCCLEAHVTHKFKQIDVVVKECVKSIDDDIEPLTSRILSFRSAADHIQAESTKLLRNIHGIEQEIKNKGEEVKQSFTRLIDRQVSDLLDKLQSLKSTAEKEVKSQVDAVQLALTELETFKTSSLELKSKGSPSDITQAASDVSVRAKELLQKHVIPDEYHAPSYMFTSVSMREDQNFIGDVISVPGTTSSFCVLTCFSTTGSS